jgi:hypothetical protein
MSKKHWLTLASVVAGLSLSVFVSCGDDTSNTKPDMSSTPDLVQSPDMGCYGNPVDNVSILNSCAPASVDREDVVPFYPANAPNGTLPQLP